MSEKAEVMLEEIIIKMQEELLHYPIEPFKKKVKRILRLLIKFQNLDKPDPFFWPNGMMAQALAESLRQNPEERTQKVLEQYVDQWILKNKPIAYVDQVMNGYAICELYERDPQQKYRDVLEQMKNELLHSAYAVDGSFLYRKNQQELVYADTIGMVCPFLCRYAVLTGESELTGLAVKQFTNFRERGFDPVSQLPYHAYHAGNGQKLGIIGWGRAVGWILLGMADSLPYLQGQELYTVQKLLQELMDNTIRYQREDGFFSWQLQALEGPKDISATSMILSAAQQMLEMGKMDEGVYRLVEKGENAILGHSDALDCCLAECEGLGSYPQYYGRYPWGDAATAKFLIKQSIAREK